MRNGFAENLHLIAAMDGVTIFYKENRCGMGELSHSLLYQISFIEVAV